MKRTLALALVVILALALAACGGNSEEKAGVGTYKGVHYKFVGDTEWVDEVFSIEFKSDGTGKFNRDDESFDLTWTLDGENVTVKETFLTLTIDYTGTLKAGVLDIFNGEPTDDLTCEYVFEKE